MFRKMPEKPNNEKLSSTMHSPVKTSSIEEDFKSLKRSNEMLLLKLEERDCKITKMEDSLKTAFEKIDRMLAARELASKAARKHGRTYRNILK